MVSTNLKRKNFPHTPKVGEKFGYEGQRYKVTSVPNFSNIVGENINSIGQPPLVAIQANKAEWL